MNCKKELTHEEKLNTSPSRVIHIRELVYQTRENDVHQALETFGSIKKVVMVPTLKQALVEFDSIDSAQALINKHRHSHIIINDRRAKVNFSTSEALNDMVNGSHVIPCKNKVLIFFILDAKFMIDVNIVLKICQPHGRVDKIFINRDSKHLYAIVQFFTVNEAILAKRHLNGADIYANCCTITIEFATMENIEISSNTDYSYNYKLISDTDLDSPSKVPTSFSGNSIVSRYRIQNSTEELNGDNQNNHKSLMKLLPTIFCENQSRVLMIYNLHHEFFNCDTVFNLVCLYGNVEKILFLIRKEGTAMVQMHNQKAAKYVIHFLHNTTAFNNKLRLKCSKQSYIYDVKLPLELKNGSPSFKVYKRSRINRFTTTEFGNKNGIRYPSRTLHYWNAPPKFSFEQLLSELTTHSSSLPSEHLLLTDRLKSSSGLIQFATTELAVQCLIQCNHIMIKIRNVKFPFQLKLSFSENPINCNVRKRPTNFNNNGCNLKVGKL